MRVLNVLLSGLSFTSVCLFFSVSDEDSGDNGRVACALSDRHFSLDRPEGQTDVYLVKLTSPLDREEAPVRDFR